MCDNKYDFNLLKELPSPFQIIEIMIEDIENLKKANSFERTEMNHKLNELRSELDHEKSKNCKTTNNHIDHQKNLLNHLQVNAELQREIQEIE